MKNKGRGNVFESVGVARQYRSAFDLSYEKKFTADMGFLYPVLADECVPGDVWRIGNRAVARMMPLLAPILHRIKMRTYYFFVPYRILDANWEIFISRGVSGNTVVNLPLMNPDDTSDPTGYVAKGTLWDMFGFPTGVVPPVEACPIDYPRRAYNLIWNEFFRDQNLQTEVDVADPENGYLLRRNWAKGYFESALPFQQRGTAPALPVVGSITGDAEFDLSFVAPVGGEQALFAGVSGGDHLTTPSGIGLADAKAGLDGALDAGTDIDITSTLSSVDIADLRLAFQLQVWMERNARAGVRYTEFLHAHFGVSPRDDRLQRPEYIGGTSNPVIISEVLQTSSTDTEPTPQGNLAGHGIAVQQTNVGSYRVEEYGVVIGLMCLTPSADYQQGINRQWLRRETFDFVFPEFVGLSEQEIFNAELYTRSVADDPTGALNRGVFGYTGRYNELRYKPNMVCGDMRDTFAYWHIGRQFSAAPALNSAFIECNPRKDIFAVPSEPGFVISFGNQLDVLRPIPFMAEPMNLGG